MKAVIFDVDGVIVDVRESYHHAIKLTAEHYLGREVPLDLIKEFKFSRGINNDWDATFELLRSFGKEVDYEDLVEKFTEFYEDLKHKEKQILSTEFFSELKDLGIPLGIVTGRPKRDLEFVLDRFSLKGLFDVTVDEDDVVDKNLRKPHPFPLHLCMESLGVESAIYVGDNKADAEMVRFYKKIYGKPVSFVHFKKVVPLSLEADASAESEEELKDLILREVSRSPEGARGSPL